MKRLVFIRGEPGSGKNTIGQLVSKNLGWHYVWFHDLYREPNADPVAIAKTVLPGLAEWLATGKNLVFTRPSRLRSTVEEVVQLARHCGYFVRVIRLTASRETLVGRVLNRQKEIWRVSDEKGLDVYLAHGGAEKYPYERVIHTDSRTPEEIADEIARCFVL